MIELDNRYDPLELNNPRLVDGATFDTALRETESWEDLNVPDIPEMTMDDIYKLTYEDIEKILNEKILKGRYNRYPWSDEGLYKIANSCPSDNIWKYITFNGKKLYIQFEYVSHEILKSGKSCILLSYSEGEIYIDGIWRYVWNKFYGVANNNGKMKSWEIELFESRYEE